VEGLAPAGLCSVALGGMQRRVERTEERCGDVWKGDEVSCERTPGHDAQCER